MHLSNTPAGSSYPSSIRPSIRPGLFPSLRREESFFKFRRYGFFCFESSFITRLVHSESSMKPVRYLEGINCPEIWLATR
jgi:hypothetical protein